MGTREQSTDSVNNPVNNPVNTSVDQNPEECWLCDQPAEFWTPGRTKVLATCKVCAIHYFPNDSYPKREDAELLLIRKAFSCK